MGSYVGMQVFLFLNTKLEKMGENGKFPFLYKLSLWAVTILSFAFGAGVTSLSLWFLIYLVKIKFLRV